MKFLIDQSKLDQALKCVQFGLLTRPSLPVLNNVHVKAEDGFVAFTLTDLEISITCKAKVEIEEAGETTIAARKLISIVRRLPSAPTQISSDTDDFVNIRSGEINFSIQGISANEFPQPFDFEPDVQFSTDKMNLHELVIKTYFATSSDSTRAAICGPLLKYENDSLSCVATDGKRLAIMTSDFSSDFEGQCIIPPKTNNALLKLMAGDGDVSIGIDEKHMSFEFINEYGQSTVINSQLIMAKYPNYSAIIPDEAEHTAILKREELLTALKRIALILSESEHGIKLEFNDNSLVIQAQTQDDESKEDLEINFSGQASIAFNPVYLIDPLKTLTCEEVTLKFSHSNSAASLSDNKGFLYVLMPMRM